MTPRRLQATAHATVVAIAALLAAPAVPADPEMEVRCAEIAFSRAVELRDAARFRASIDPDARFVGGGERVSRGPDEVFAGWAPFFEEQGPRIAWRPRIVEVLAGGELALSRGPYRLRAVGQDGEAIERWGTFNSVWRRDADGVWRVIFDAGSASDEVPGEAALALLEAPLPICDDSQAHERGDAR